MARAGRQYDSISDRLDALREMHAEADAAEAASKASVNRENATGVFPGPASGSDRVTVEDGGGAPGSGTRLLLHAPAWAEVTEYFDDNILHGSSRGRLASLSGAYPSPIRWKIARDLQDREVVCANEGCFEVNIEFAGSDDDSEDDGDDDDDKKGSKGKGSKHRRLRNAEVVGMKKFKRCAGCGVAAYCSKYTIAATFITTYLLIRCF
jgi:hypothetical protein